MGASDTDTVSSLAGRLDRLNKQLDDKDLVKIKKTADGVELTQIIRDLLDAVDGDNVEAKALELSGQPEGTNAGDDKRDEAQAELVKAAAKVLTGEPH